MRARHPDRTTRFVALIAAAMLLLMSLAAMAPHHREPPAPTGAASLAYADKAPCLGDSGSGKTPSPRTHIDHTDCCLNCPQRALPFARIGVETAGSHSGADRRGVIAVQYSSHDDSLRTMPGWSTSWSSRAPPAA